MHGFWLSWVVTKIKNASDLLGMFLALFFSPPSFYQHLQHEAHKLLLLGTGEAGKSTFVKQMKILYGIGFSDEEKRTFRVDVLNNVIDGIKILIAGMDTLGIPYEVTYQKRIPDYAY